MTPSWLKFVPAAIRARIEHRPHLLNAMSNTGWLFGDHAVRLGVGLVVSVWLARYLGPEEFGLLSYAAAFVAIFAALAGPGLGNIVVRDLVRDPQSAGRTLGSAFVLQLLLGALAFLLAVAAIDFVRPGDILPKLIVTLLGLVMLLKAAEVVKYWFESQVQSRYAVWGENGVYLVFAAVKVALILHEAPLMAFVWAMLAEGLVAALVLMAVYAWRGGRYRSWCPCFGRAWELLKDGWPLILSGLAAMAYMRIDQIMLGQMMGDESVGIYSAAVRISEVWNFIPVAIVASVFPAIIEAKKEDEPLYYQRLQSLYDLMVVLALAVAIPLTVFSDFLVKLVFGEAYGQAGSVLAIHIWTSVFVFLGVASGKWFVVEGLTRLALRRNLFGAVLNILLNLVLIPVWGLAGAAVATLTAVSVAAYFSDLLSAPTRKVFVQKSNSLLGPFRTIGRILYGKIDQFKDR